MVPLCGALTDLGRLRPLGEAACHASRPRGHGGQAATGASAPTSVCGPEPGDSTNARSRSRPTCQSTRRRARAGALSARWRMRPFPGSYRRVARGLRYLTPGLRFERQNLWRWFRKRIWAAEGGNQHGSWLPLLKTTECHILAMSKVLVKYYSHLQNANSGVPTAREDTTSVTGRVYASRRTSAYVPV